MNYSNNATHARCKATKMAEKFARFSPSEIVRFAHYLVNEAPKKAEALVERVRNEQDS